MISRQDQEKKIFSTKYPVILSCIESNNKQMKFAAQAFGLDFLYCPLCTVLTTFEMSVYNIIPFG